MKMTFQPKKKIQSESSRIQSKNEHSKRQKSSCCQKSKRKEKYCQHRPHICGLFFSLIETYGVFMIFSESLKKNQDFQRVYRAADSRANRYLVLYRLENGLSKNRIGISVSKKVGNSVVRHHMCRLIRESYRLNENH